MEYRDVELTGETILLDGATLTGCTLRQCRLVFNGIAGVNLGVNTFIDCTWSFDGPAARTVQFLKALYTGGGKALVDRTIEDIRAAKP